MCSLCQQRGGALVELSKLPDKSAEVEALQDTKPPPDDLIIQDCNSEEERWQRSLMHFAGAAYRDKTVTPDSPPP